MGKKKNSSNILWVIFALFMISGIAVFQENSFSGAVIVLTSLIALFPPIREFFRNSIFKKKSVMNILSVVIAALGFFIAGINMDSADFDTFKDTARNMLNDDYKSEQDIDEGLEGQDYPEEKPENQFEDSEDIKQSDNQENIQLESIPEYSGEPYVVVNDNIPQFTEAEKQEREAYEYYSELDELGRVGMAIGVLGKETMPEEGEKRGSIGNVKPSGWQSEKYDIVSGKYLYNRCHLIGWQLSAENANRKNLMTGTRYFNVDGMLPFENLTTDYIKETGNHVRYRVTPVFQGDNLVADGVQIEAYSVEDQGEGVEFNIFCYNVQPGIVIDYSDGTSYEE